MRPSILFFLIAWAVTTPAAADPVQVNRKICDRMVLHDPAPDTAYRGGIDVRGRPVVPADIGAGAVALPPMIPLDIVVPAGPAGGSVAMQSDRRKGARAEIYAGQALVAPDGTVLFNGRPLRDPESAHLARLCREMSEKR